MYTTSKILAWVVLVIGLLGPFPTFADDEKDWNWYIKCVDTSRNDKVLIEERDTKQYGIDSTTRIYKRTETGNWLYYFTMGANIWCTMMHREDYESSR